MPTLRSRLFTRLARTVSRHPVIVLAIAALTVIACLGYTWAGLSFQADRNDLISRDLPWNQRFIHWRQTFTGTSDLLVVIDTEPDEAEAKQAVDWLGPRLADNQWIAHASWGLNTADAPPKLIRSLPMARFDRELARLSQARTVLQSENPSTLLANTIAQLSSQQGDTSEEQASARLSRFADTLAAFDARLSAPADQHMDLAKRIGGEDQWEYLATPNGRLLLIRLRPELAQGELNPIEPAIEATRELLDRARQKFAGVEMGLTGIDVIEADETAAANRDSVVSSIVAAVLIAGLLMLAFQSVRTPMMLMAALGVGIAWSFGFLTLAIGHLQVISVVFTVILLGLGVAFGIHLAARFEMIRHGYRDSPRGFAAAMADTLRTMGPGLVTGALTTSAAFSTTMLTDYDGVAEMGLIAAAGVMLCLVAMLTVFPALLRLVKGRTHHIRPMEGRWIHFFETRWVMPFARRPKTTLAVVAVLTAGSLFGLSRMSFDYNLLKLLPQGAPSVTWNRRLTERGGQAIYAATTIVDGFDQARTMAGKLRSLDTVGGLGGAGMLLPADEDAKLAKLRDARQALQPALGRALQAQPANGGNFVQQLTTLSGMLGLGASRVPDSVRPAYDRLSKQITHLIQTVRGLDPAVREDRLAALRRDYAQWRRHVAQRIDRTLDTSPVTLADVPEQLMDTYVAPQPDGASGGPKVALEVYPELPPGITDPLDPRFLSKFVGELEGVDPGVTGVIVQVYHAGSLILRSYTMAGGFALVAVFALVYLDFRSLTDAALSLLPTAVGFACTFGVLWLVGRAINPANIIVLPLMFGIGVDAGVHILHRYQQDPVTRPLGLTAGTGKGVSITSYTTMIGFGAMMLAHHRGIFSLGLTLTLGIGLTLLACWTVMPAWLELRTRRRETRA